MKIKFLNCTIEIPWPSNDKAKTLLAILLIVSTCYLAVMFLITTLITHAR
jgi:hypothetical protein